MSEDRFPGSALRAIQLQIGSQRIAGYESPGTARAILLVHGNSSSSRVWQKQLEGPLGGKYRLIAIDLPGHGRSSPPPNPEQDYSGAGYSACIAAVVRELELRDAVIVGWSLGGHAVLNAARSLPSAAGLMIFGTPPIGRTSEGFSGFKALSPTVFTPAPSDAEIDAAIKSAFAPGFAPIPAFVGADFRNTDGAARGYLQMCKRGASQTRSRSCATSKFRSRLCMVRRSRSWTSPIYSAWRRRRCGASRCN